MTSSQDPNQPGQPGTPQPDWGPLPPATPPTWGTPPPGYPPQPGYPAQPGYPPQPGWGPPQGYPPPGYPPQAGYAPGWGPQGWGPPPQRSRKGCWIGVIAAVVVLGIIGLLVVSCARTLGPALTTGTAIENNSGGRITNVSYNWYNGTGSFSITVAPGIGSEEGRTIACQVVKPTLKGTQFEGTHFVIFDQTGYQLASDLTACP